MDPTSPAGVANVLGALALAVSDRAERAVEARTGLASTSAAALNALREFLDRPSVEDLRRVLGLTHSGTVRLVDRLAATGLVARAGGVDGRSRQVVLTEEGRRLAAEAARARGEALSGLLDGFDDAERSALRSALGRLVGAVVATKDGGAWTCRFCHLAACGRAAGHCPAATAAAARYGPISGVPPD